ncbi:MAG: asparagine synthase (glutamine-hydrolyzing) [Bacteroidia bacterium]|nr:asparagine synthase (glutamine-hydrolyzing) [Bacteroidia bacterium]
MCGICGIINFNSEQVRRNHLEIMMNKMKQRGPDDEGIFIDNNIGLGFVRLNIIDLTYTGHQPMFSDDNRYCIVYNGEIYNYIELKETLSDRYIFKSNSDTEVILAAYKEYGEACINKFIGMWAFLIYDIEKKKVFISRDRFGIKPFYYYTDKDKFIFASDIQSIIKLLSYKINVNWQIIYDYLIFTRTDQSENTFFKEIKKLQHGCNLNISVNSDKNIKISKWYDLPKEIKEPFINEEEFRHILYSSIKIQLRSDVPVGVCLSGGLDSSTITSILLKEFRIKNLHSFSAIYTRGQLGDESEFINEYKNEDLNMHFVYPSAKTLYEDLSIFLNAMAEPMPTTSEYAEFKVMQLAKEHCTVLLNGQGADELMGGYLYFFGYYFKELLYNFKWRKLLKEIITYYKIQKNFIGIYSFIYFILPQFIQNKKYIFKINYYSNVFIKNQSKDSHIVRDLYSAKTLKESFLNHFEHKFEHHLLWADKSGMWFSLETRFPFLDHRFVEKTLALDSSEIIEKGITKKILRQAFEGILPAKITNRIDKVGYQTPTDEWFKKLEFVNLSKEILNSQKFKQRGIYNCNKVNSLFNKYIEGKINFGNEIWKIINLELWFNKYIDN